MSVSQALVNGMGAAWLRWMWPMAWQTAVLAGIVWLLTGVLRRQSASFRCALWLLVFVKLVLPPSLAVPWSAATVIHHAYDASGIETARTGSPAANRFAGAREEAATPGISRLDAYLRPGNIPAAALLMSVWFAGVAGLFVLLIFQARRYTRKALQDSRPADGQTTQTVERLCAQIGVRGLPMVLMSPHIRIPAVFGFWRATILLPESLLRELNEHQRSNLICHELAHIRRRDIQVGWAVSLLLCCYWFNPAVWLANLYLRREREMACDDTVLYATRQEGREYSATIVRVAEFFDGSVPAGAGFLGMLEVSDNLLLRVRSTLDGTRSRRLGWHTVLALVLFLAFLLPMGVWSFPANAAPEAQAAAPGPEAAAASQETPRLLSSAPANGAKEVDPALDRIVLTFDRDMAGGFSWTGGPPLFPETTGKPQWLDKRNCMLPVKLETGRLYRLGINSKSHRNFRSAGGIPVAPQVLAFSTKGADAATAAGLEAPKVVSLAPDDGAQGVDPNLTRLTVTFDQPMAGGFSWTGSGDHYPETTGKPEWSADGKTCTLPVKLKPNWEYVLGLNSTSHNNFQNAQGIPLKPVPWQFRTAAR